MPKTDVSKVVIAMACDLVMVKCEHYRDVIIPSEYISLAFDSTMYHFKTKNQFRESN